MTDLIVEWLTGFIDAVTRIFGILKCDPYKNENAKYVSVVYNKTLGREVAVNLFTCTEPVGWDWAMVLHPCKDLMQAPGLETGLKT